VDPQHLAGQADPQGHSRRRGRRGGGQDRRAGAGGLQPWRPAARRRAVVDRGAAGDRRCRRLADRDHVRRRHPLRQDVMRALALGAKSCMIGRAYATASAPAAKPASPRRSTSSPTNSASPWACAASTPSPRSTSTCWRFDRAAQVVPASSRRAGPALEPCWKIGATFGHSLTSPTLLNALAPLTSAA
jgi:hypothetical protein